MQSSCFAGTLPTNVMQGHPETTDHTTTAVDMVKGMVRDMVTGTSTKAVETAATKAERGKAMAVSKTHHIGETTLIYLIDNFGESDCTRFRALSPCNVYSTCISPHSAAFVSMLTAGITSASLTFVAITHISILLWQLESYADLLQGKQEQQQTTQQQTRASQAPQQKS